MQTTSTQDGTNQESLKSDDTSSTKKTFNVDIIKRFFSIHLAKVSAETIGWLAVMLMHCATIPPVVGLILGISDRLPAVDVVMFVWAGLVLLFLRALVLKDMLNIITIGGGFVVQAALLGLLVFK